MSVGPYTQNQKWISPFFGINVEWINPVPPSKVKKFIDCFAS